MPAAGTEEVVVNAERTAVMPIVRFLSGGGAGLRGGQVLKIEDSAGITPSKAWISIRNTQLDQNSYAVSLVDNDLAVNKLKMGSFVRITHDGEDLFVGAIVKRTDTGNDQIILECWDDRWLLAKIPVRGCLVYDPANEDVIFVPRYICRTNPNGFNNCTLVEGVGDSDGRIPVFTALAEAGTLGKSSDADEATGEANAEQGIAIPWTPERFLQYLRLFSHFDPSAFDSKNYYKQDIRRLDSRLTTWLPGDVNFPGAEMRKKMPDIIFQGMSLLGAIVKTLDVSGEYGLWMLPQDKKCRVCFYPRSLRQNDGGNQQDIPLQRSGPALDLNTAFDYSAFTDASETCTGVLVEGASPKMEAEFKYTNTPAEDALIKAWSAAEETDYFAIIKGNNTWASVLEKPGDFGGKRVLMDGTNDAAGNPTPRIPARTNAAVTLARQHYPKVFRAMQLVANPTTIPMYHTIMKGVDDAYENVPILNISRPPQLEQLQPYRDDGNDVRGWLRYPFRIQITGTDTDNVWHDVGPNNGLRVTADGLIWFDGLTDNDGLSDRIYTNQLRLNDITPVKLKKIKINCAIPLDCRMKSTAFELFDGGTEDPNDIYDQLNEDLVNLAGTGARSSLQHYVFAPDSYRQEEQINSYPAAHKEYKNPTGGTNADGSDRYDTAPLARVLHTDAVRIDGHAKRRFKDKVRFKKTQKWRMIGIRSEYRAGYYIGQVVFSGAGATGGYKVGAPLGKVTWDFENQETVLEPE